MTREPLLTAPQILDRLGAAPRAAMVRRRLTAMGAPSVPRGPRLPARQSPAGLTARQTEVLGLLAEGLTYRQIADRLHLSAKTVDHHVAAVRVKLDVRTRAAAVAAGCRLGILPVEAAHPAGGVSEQREGLGAIWGRRHPIWGVVPDVPPRAGVYRDPVEEVIATRPIRSYSTTPVTAPRSSVV